MTRVLLLARSATTATALADMERLGAETASLPGVTSATFAFSEEGTPSLRDAVCALVQSGADAIVIVPLLLPAEANFNIWLRRTLQRWQAGKPWPEIRIAPFLSGQPAMRDLLASAIGSRGGTVVRPLAAPGPEKAVVPPQKRRVLICMGGPCHAAGSAVIWGHLRNEQTRLGLRTAGDGTMTAKTSCLGPCGLAPVLQVWPEGTMYGGIDEDGVDRIVQHHLLKGQVVADLARSPTGTGQSPR
jgi:(2Fe-2S) ferredoxin